MFVGKKKGRQGNGEKFSLKQFHTFPAIGIANGE